jgi:uncharacterized protein (TIGR01777 family)
MADAKNILITGASGLIGSRLTQLLLERGDRVAHLGRSGKPSEVKSFIWDIKKRKIDTEAFASADTIIHLAGASVADKRWTNDRKKEIIESRTESTRLLFETLRSQKHSVKNFISASGTGYYGFGDAETVFTENSKPGNDFLAQVTQHWENEADKIQDLGIRVVKIRIGIVLSEKGGALKEIAKPVKFLAGAPLGSGDQIVSWIHLDDLCSVFLKAIDDEKILGVYNAVAPHPVTNRELTKAIGVALNKPVFLPAVPAILLRLALGEMSEIVLEGNKVSAEKILQSGFTFHFTTLEKALTDLLKKETR